MSRTVKNNKTANEKMTHFGGVEDGSHV